MSEDSFFNALAHIMWEMEVDIFSEREKTLALVADFVPKCKKQQKRLQAMYDCGAMELIAEAIENKEQYAQLMWQAADLLCEHLETDEEKAVFAVNQIINLWDGELPALDLNDDDESNGDDDEMLFLQDVTEEEKQQESPANDNAEGGEQPAAAEEQPKEPVLTRLVRFWCANDCEQGRPLMIACPIGWIIILLCCAAGFFMIYDTPIGDDFVPPVFLFMFALLVGKRQYRYESVGRLTIVLLLCYLASCAKALWIGSGSALRCIPIIAAAFIVFNNGRFASLLDGEKRRSFAAYSLIIIMSAIVTAGVYAIQNVQL